MTASIWAPGSTNVPSVDPASQLLSQSFVATEGQTDFVITQFTYSINSGALTVYVNRAKLDHQYVTELNTTTFRIPACEVGDDVEVVGNVAIEDPSLYADAAAASALEALGYKNQAETYKNDAAASASNADISEATALGYANSAATSESNALTYKGQAETAKVAAQLAEANAKVSETTAVSAMNSAVNASNAAVAAASNPNVIAVGQDLLEPVSEIEVVGNNIAAVNTVGANIPAITNVNSNMPVIVDAPVQAANAAASAVAAQNASLSVNNTLNQFVNLQYLQDWGFIYDTPTTITDYGVLV